MKKNIVLLIFSVLVSANIYSQCNISLSLDTNVIDCGDSVILTLSGTTNSVFVADAAGDSLPPGWSSATNSVSYNNPCIPPSPSPPTSVNPNTSFYWFGNTANVPRFMETPAYDLTYGTQICFDFIYAIQGSTSNPCPPGAPANNTEGPDLSEEGITLQYSLDGGTTWIDIVYFMPNGQQLPSNPGPGFTMTPPFNNTGTPYTVWNSVCIPLPAAAQTTNVIVRLGQEYSSGVNNDHWGLDNFEISALEPGFNYYVGDDTIPVTGATTTSGVTANGDTTFSVILSNFIDDTCSQTVSFSVNPTVAMDDIFTCEGVGVGDTLSLTGVAPWAPVVWTPSLGLDDPTSHTPFANPPSPGPSQTYTVTSACGSDSVTTTFYSVDAIAEKDTVCPGQIDQLYANVEGFAQDCETDYSFFQIPFNKEENSSPTSAAFTNTNNGISPSIVIPFPFDFYCVQTSQVRMTVDGYLAMSAAGFPSQPLNGPLPNTSPPSPIIALMWADLVDSAGTSSYFVNGTAPNRKMVFEFDLVHNGANPSNGAVKGQIILHETTNFIDILCENCMTDPNPPTPNSTQGIKVSGANGIATPGRNFVPWSANNSAYRFIPNLTSATAQSVSWTPTTNIYGANTLAPIVTPDSTTQYTVTVINNSDSCTYFDTITVFVEEPLFIDASPDTSICLGESLVIPATSSTTTNVLFEWTPNDASIADNTLLNPTVTPDSTTTYIMEADLNGCIALDTMVVAVNSFVIDSTIVVNEECVANTGSISIYASGQTAGLQYSIDNGATYQTSNVFSGLGGGTYTIRVGSVNCDTSFVDSIIPAAAPMVVNSINTYPAACGTLGALSLDITGGAQPLMYSIDNGVTFSPLDSFPNLMGNSYAVLVEDTEACFLDTLVVVSSTNAVDLVVDNTTLVTCSGDADGTVTLSTTGGQAPFQYSIDGINYVSSNTFTSLDTGSFVAYVVDTNGCNDSVIYTINEPNPLDVQITVPGNVLCAGGTIDSLVAIATGGTPGYSYEWNTTETTSTIQSIVFGNYWVEVTDTNLCVTSDSVIIQQPIPLYLSIASDSVQCGGQNSGLAYIDSVSGGIPTYSYNWVGPTGPVTGNDTAANLPAGQYILTVSDFNSCIITDTTVIYEPSPVVIGLVPTNLSCFGDSDGCIDATVTGGTPPYAFSWSHGPTTEDVCALSAGWYTFTVTDARGCVYVDSAEILQPTVLSLSTTQVDVSCNGLDNGSATVNVTGGTTAYTYDWVGTGQTTPTASALFAGNYTVIVTDANSCVDSIAVTITEPTDSITLTIDNITDVLCNGASTGAIAVSTSGGTPGYTYSWTNGGGTNEDLSNASAGTYTLTVTDANGCPNSITRSIAEPPALAISLTASNTTCFGASTGAVDATVSGGNSPYTYAWSGPNGFTAVTEDITGVPAGTYTLTATDANNCVLSQNTIITEPAVVSIGFTQSPVNCFGGNDGSLTASVITGGTAPFSFQWDAAANNQTTATATGLEEGNYMVTVTDANGCTYSDNSNVTEPNAPLAIFLDSTNITCASYDDGVGVVSASGGTPGYSYLWNDPQAQTTPQASNLPPGTFQVTVTDANGCIETGSISISEPMPISVSATPDSTNCFGDASGAISIVASGGTTVGFAYSIDGGDSFQNSSDFYNLPAGVYDDIIVQDLGSNVECYSVPISSTVYEQPYFSFVVNPDDTTLQLEESLTLALDVTSPNYTNQDIAQVNWYPTTGLNCSDCIDPTVLTYDHYTEYTATVYYFGDDNELCNTVASTIITVENNLALFIPNAFTPSNYDEVNKNFEVYGEGIEYITMQVYNRIGEKIFESGNQKVSWDGTFQGELQSPGVYTYYVSVEYLDGKTVDRKGSVTLLR